VFFTVCGAKKGQACVIERTASAAAVRKAAGSTLTQANHFNLAKFRSHNELMTTPDEDDPDAATFLDDSILRQTTLARRLMACQQADNLDEVGACLDQEPVLNDDSSQQMVFCPTNGTYKVWRYCRG
jgi:hypothetical protein